MSGNTAWNPMCSVWRIQKNKGAVELGDGGWVSDFTIPLKPLQFRGLGAVCTGIQNRGAYARAYAVPLTVKNVGCGGTHSAPPLAAKWLSPPIKWMN